MLLTTIYPRVKSSRKDIKGYYFQKKALVYKKKKLTLTLSKTLNPTQPLTTLNNPKHKTTLNTKKPKPYTTITNPKIYPNRKIPLTTEKP